MLPYELVTATLDKVEMYRFILIGHNQFGDCGLFLTLAQGELHRRKAAETIIKPSHLSAFLQYSTDRSNPL